MAQPALSTYSVAAGQPIHGGRWPGGRLSGNADLAAALAAGAMEPNAADLGGGVVAGDVVAAGQAATAPHARTILVGDSLTTHLLGYNLSPFFWANGLLGAPLKPVGNLGVSGNTVADVLARINNSYGGGGLSGSSPLGYVVLRVGTNDARSTAIHGGIQASYDALLAAILTYADVCIVCAVPPIGSPESGGSNVAGYNAWLQAKCATNPDRLWWVDDCVTVRNGSAWAAGYAPADGIHFTPRAVYQMGVDGAAALAGRFDAFGYASPLSTDPADKYPAVAQWWPNPTNVGSGTLVNNLGIGSYGAGFGWSNSIVAADAGDPNPVPWQRLTPTAVVYGGDSFMLLSGALTGRTITSSDPAALEIVYQIRFNAFAGQYYRWLRAYVLGAENGNVTPDLDLKLGQSNMTHTVTVRGSLPRASGGAPQSAATLRLELSPSTSFTGAMGSIDVRCIAVRG